MENNFLYLYEWSFKGTKIQKKDMFINYLILGHGFDAYCLKLPWTRFKWSRHRFLVSANMLSKELLELLFNASLKRCRSSISICRTPPKSSAISFTCITLLVNDSSVVSFLECEKLLSSVRICKHVSYNAKHLRLSVRPRCSKKFLKISLPRGWVRVLCILSVIWSKSWILSPEVHFPMQPMVWLGKEDCIFHCFSLQVTKLDITDPYMILRNSNIYYLTHMR